MCQYKLSGTGNGQLLREKPEHVLVLTVKRLRKMAKCIFAIDGIQYLSQTKREARRFIDFWHQEAITFDYPRPFKTAWRFQHIERAPSYGQLYRVDFPKIEYGKAS